MLKQSECEKAYYAWEEKIFQIEKQYCEEEASLLNEEAGLELAEECWMIQDVKPFSEKEFF